MKTKKVKHVTITSLNLLDLSCPNDVVEGCFEFRVDNLVLGHHVHCLQVQELLSRKGQVWLEMEWAPTCFLLQSPCSCLIKLESKLSSAQLPIGQRGV